MCVIYMVISPSCAQDQIRFILLPFILRSAHSWTFVLSIASPLFFCSFALPLFSLSLTHSWWLSPCQSQQSHWLVWRKWAENLAIWIYRSWWGRTCENIAGSSGTSNSLVTSRPFYRICSHFDCTIDPLDLLDQNWICSWVYRTWKCLIWILKIRSLIQTVVLVVGLWSELNPEQGEII